MVLATIKDGLRKTFIDVPVGSLYWSSGALQYAFWYVPSKLGLGFAQDVLEASRKSMKRGRERAF